MSAISTCICSLVPSISVNGRVACSLTRVRCGAGAIQSLEALAAQVARDLRSPFISTGIGELQTTVTIAPSHRPFISHRVALGSAMAIECSYISFPRFRVMEVTETLRCWQAWANFVNPSMIVVTYAFGLFVVRLFMFAFLMPALR